MPRVVGCYRTGRQFDVLEHPLVRCASPEGDARELLVTRAAAKKYFDAAVADDTGTIPSSDFTPFQPGVFAITQPELLEKSAETRAPVSQFGVTSTATRTITIPPTV